MIVIWLSLTSFLFYGRFYTDTESKSPYLLKRHLPPISSFSLSGSIVTPTPTPKGKLALGK